MTSKKIRHEFLADAAVSAKLNTLVRSGATKTDIIVQAIKAFVERGTETEFSRLTAKRFDVFSREHAAIRQDLEAVRRELEAERKGRGQMEADVKTILEETSTIRGMATAKLPPDSKELQIPSRGFFGIFR
ncbi:MAG: hypothetical protein PHW76_10400 [Alphaproteobacteria bacterium]|nr:hypothetical protein [Alphaproteobacteria bacterium]